MDLKVSGFQLLPNDLIFNIFTYVSVRDLGNCAQLSKNLRLIANDKELWIKFLFTRGQIPDGFVEYVLSKGKVIHPKHYKNLREASLWQISFKVYSIHQVKSKTLKSLAF